MRYMQVFLGFFLKEKTINTELLHAKLYQATEHSRTTSREDKYKTLENLQSRQLWTTQTESQNPDIKTECNSKIQYICLSDILGSYKVQTPAMVLSQLSKNQILVSFPSSALMGEELTSENGMVEPSSALGWRGKQGEEVRW